MKPLRPEDIPHAVFISDPPAGYKEPIMRETWLDTLMRWLRSRRGAWAF